MRPLSSQLTTSTPNQVALVVHITHAEHHTRGRASRHPTVQAYEPFIVAYDHFNRALFKGKPSLKLVCGTCHKPMNI